MASARLRRRRLNAPKVASAALRSTVDLVGTVVTALLVLAEPLHVPTTLDAATARKILSALLNRTDFVRLVHAVRLGPASMSATPVPIRRPRGNYLRRALSIPDL